MKSGNKPRIKTVRDGENMNIEKRLNVKSKQPRTPTLRRRRDLDWQAFKLVDILDLTVNYINRDASPVIALRY